MNTGKKKIQRLWNEKRAAIITTKVHHRTLFRPGWIPVTSSMEFSSTLLYHLPSDQSCFYLRLWFSLGFATTYVELLYRHWVIRINCEGCKYEFFFNTVLSSPGYIDHHFSKKKNLNLFAFLNDHIRLFIILIWMLLFASISPSAMQKSCENIN
jgi:hypothetical protein